MIQKLFLYIVKQLVEDQSAVSVQLKQEDEKEILEIAVAEKDRGKVIGKEGRNIKALRGLATALAKDRRIIIEVA